jgi:hypothetical protein
MRNHFHLAYPASSLVWYLVGAWSNDLNSGGASLKLKTKCQMLGRGPTCKAPVRN